MENSTDFAAISNKEKAQEELQKEIEGDRNKGKNGARKPKRMTITDQSRGEGIRYPNESLFDTNSDRRSLGIDHQTERIEIQSISGFR